MIIPLWSGVKAIVCGLVAQFVSAVVQAQVPCTGMKTSWPAGTLYGRPYHTTTAPAASNKSGASTRATRGRMEWMRDAIASTMQSGRPSDQGVLHWARRRSRPIRLLQRRQRSTGHVLPAYRIQLGNQRGQGGHVVMKGHLLVGQQAPSQNQRLRLHHSLREVLVVQNPQKMNPSRFEVVRNDGRYVLAIGLHLHGSQIGVPERVVRSRAGPDDPLGIIGVRGAAKQQGGGRAPVGPPRGVWRGNLKRVRRAPRHIVVRAIQTRDEYRRLILRGSGARSDRQQNADEHDRGFHGVSPLREITKGRGCQYTDRRSPCRR